MTIDKLSPRNVAIFTTVSIFAFFLGLTLGLIIVLANKYLHLKYISDEFVIVLWSLWWGLSAYSLLFTLENSIYKFKPGMALHTFAYSSGIYLALFRGAGSTHANLFAGMAMLGLIIIITAPPVIAKFLKHKFIQRAR